MPTASSEAGAMKTLVPTVTAPVNLSAEASRATPAVETVVKLLSAVLPTQGLVPWARVSAWIKQERGSQLLPGSSPREAVPVAREAVEATWGRVRSLPPPVRADALLPKGSFGS